MMHLSKISCLTVVLTVLHLSGPSAIGQIDSARPSFTLIGADPAVVDVSQDEATTDVLIRITDDVSGFSSGSILVNLDDTSLKWFFNNNSLAEGLPTDGLYRVAITFPRGSPPGIRELGAIVFDNAGRSDSGYPDGKFIEIINNGPLIDREPPTLHNVTITPQVLDLTNGPGSVTVEFDVSDDATGISSLWSDFIPPVDEFSPDSRKFVWYGATEGDERKVLTGTYPFGAYTPEGEWRLELEQLFDGVFRSSPYDFGAPEYYEKFDAILTIINPHEDLEPPILESINFPDPTADTTFGEVDIPYSVHVKDAGSGIATLSVRLHAPSGSEYHYSYTNAANEFEDDELQDINLEKDFEVPPFIEQGSWKISVRIQDRAGHYITYGYDGDKPLPAGSTPVVNIQNLNGADLEDMEVTGFTYSPNPVDITDQSQFVELQFSYSDNLSGFERASVRIESPDEEFSESVYMDIEDLTDGNLTEGTVTAGFQIPRFSEPGEWTIESFSLTDRAGNYMSLITYPVFIGGLPNSITVVNNGPVDREKPELVEFSLSTTTIDVTHEQQRPLIHVSAWDDYSGVDQVYFTYELESTGDRINFYPASSDLVSVEDNIHYFEESTLVRTFQPPGDYVLTRIEAEDNLGREREYRNDRGDDPLPEVGPATITIVNNGIVDFEDPVMSGIRISQSSFDVTSSEQFLVVEIDYTDDASGMTDVEVRMGHEDGLVSYTLFDSWLDDDVYQVLSGDSLSGTVQLVCTIPRFLPPGAYTLSYEVIDLLRRDATLSGSSSSFPFPDAATIEITNEEAVDRTDPVLVGMEFPDSVDVTDLAREIPVSIRYLDDVSGIQELNLYLRSPSGDLIAHYLTGEDLTSGTATEGTFNFQLPIPAFSEAGTWEISCFFEDGVQHLEFLDSVELAAQGLRSTFEIVNRQPEGYLWRESEAYAGDWRYQEWFGWVQDQKTYPYVYHLEHGWIYSSGTDPEAFHMYDTHLGVWWWINEDLYPYMYASGRLSGWYYYYAPYGQPGQRWFHHLATGTDVPESGL